MEVPVPRFMLDDVSLDPVSGSKVLVKLSSTNPSSSRIYYSEMSLHVQMEEIFETERVLLQSTVQAPHERTTWTGVVARNNVNSDKPDGTFQMRDGVENGDVIAEVKIQKNMLIFKSKKRRLRVTCPVLLNLKDLTAVVSRPMSTCQVL
ncbi:Late embryogenesis abundant (LEA) hydroxyproline-rich glycoprotein family [Raphanus sativus]|nr:Late embryogenesis abundant (LEA) hydroxyproline-rich glycoprotein family [Raphanus sativus]